MNKRWINVGILAGVFIVAVIFFSFLTNRGNDNTTADLGTATLPGISFSCDGFAVNPLQGYKTQREVTTMRETFTPVVGNQVVMNIESYGRKIYQVSYRILSLDGKEILAEEKAEKVGSQMTLPIDGSLLSTERMLEVVLDVEGDSIYYYTRLKDVSGCNLTACLDYVYEFHENAIGKVENKGIETAIEPSAEGDNTTYQKVTIHSDFEHVTWGDLEPKLYGKERWLLLETNAGCSSVKLEYEVFCSGEEPGEELYHVEEFFRVRSAGDQIYLLDYERDMSQVFDSTKDVLSEKGISLGIVPEDLEYVVNEDGTIVSFVQTNELWNYNLDRDELSLLFSFREVENNDMRNMVDNHDIQIMSVEENGDTIFTVSGYMNRGPHEGEVGIALYQYDSEKNSIEEQIFIPSVQSADMASEELEQILAYNKTAEYLYILVDGRLLEVDIKMDYVEELAAGLEKGQVVLSQDGKNLAYQSNGSYNKATEIVVKNLESGEDYTVTCKEGECIKPVGFVYEDFVVGTAHKEDAGLNILGKEILPMYKVEIKNAKNEVLKTYESVGRLVEDAVVDEDLLSLYRVERGNGVYHPIVAEYITNNEDKPQSNITKESYSTEKKGTQTRLTFVEGISDKEPKVLKPKQVLFENAGKALVTDEEKGEGYYPYGYGTYHGATETAGEAIRLAHAYNGVATDNELRYLYERGNRYLQYQILRESEKVVWMEQQMKSGKRPWQFMQEREGGEILDLTGCKVEEVLFLLNKDVPILGMLDETNGVILTGYTEELVFYLDINSGMSSGVPYAYMDQMLAGSGNAMIAYME